MWCPVAFRNVQGVCSECGNMAVCALHRTFFLSTMLIWTLVTVYVLRSGIGITGTEEIRKAQDTLTMMNELERQNLQLKELARKMRGIEIEHRAKAFADIEQKQNMLESMHRQLDECQSKNVLLRSQVTELLKKPNNSIDEKGENSTEYGLRALHSNVLDLWYFIRSKVNAVKSEGDLPKKFVKDLEYFLDDVRTRKSAALIEVELMQRLRSEVQKEEIGKLQELVQRRLHILQNPRDCSNARKLVCNLNKGCGFGCQLHHVTYCFLIAIGTQRTFVLDSANWRYSGEGWESVFLPLSKTCTTASASPHMWNGEEHTSDVQIITLPIIDALKQRPSYLPLSIPKDLAQELTKYHGNPSVWWLGQVVSYLIRPQPYLHKAVRDFEDKIGFKHPIAGMHIRRTDKVGSEAAFHHVSEYMIHIADWFDKEDLKRQRTGQQAVLPRTVYVASDDHSVLAQARKLYPEYQFLGDSEISKSAELLTRYSKSSLIGVLIDIYLLSKCDYMVGTFSSQVSRSAFELMQTHHPDASSLAHSLDDIFYFGGQSGHSQIAIYDHEAKPGTEEISLKTGDFIGVAGNHWDGFSKGTNRRTNKVGLYPSYKVVDVITMAEFPTYGVEKFNGTSVLKM